jgi:hypothetical protein
VSFQDLQQLDNPMNDSHLGTATEIVSLFRSLVGRKPFLFELRGENGFTLTIGLANDCASVQYSSSDGLPPYLMAVAAEGEDGEFVEFLAGNTPTPIPRRFCLPTTQVVEIANAFVSHGGKSDSVDWEEI